MNALRLALAYLRHRPFAAALNVVLLALGTAAIAFLLIGAGEFDRRLRADADAVDMVVGAKGSPMQLVLSSVFHADVPVGNVKVRDARALEGHPMVAAVIPLALGDGFRGYRIVGTTHAYVRKYGGALAEGALWRRPLDAVVGAAVAANIGLGVGSLFVGEHGVGGGGHAHEEHPYRVTGVLAPSGTVLDRLVLTSVETVRLVHEPADEHGQEDDHGHGDEDMHAHGDGHEDEEMHAHEDRHEDEEMHMHEDAHAHGGAHDRNGGVSVDDGVVLTGAGDEEVTALLIDFTSPLAAVSLPREINQGTVMQAARPALEIRRLLRIAGFGAEVVGAFALVLVLAAGCGVFAALFHALEERRTDLAMMRVLGATRLRLFWQVLLEGLTLSAVGAALGLGLAHGAAWLVGQWLWATSQVAVSAGWVGGEALLALGVLALGAAAALPSAVRAFRLDIPRVLSGG